MARIVAPAPGVPATEGATVDGAGEEPGATIAGEGVVVVTFAGVGAAVGGPVMPLLLPPL